MTKINNPKTIDGYKMSYNISDIIEFLRYAKEPWLVEWDNMSPSEKQKTLKERHALLKNIVGDKFKGFKPSTVEDMDKHK